VTTVSTTSGSKTATVASATRLVNGQGVSSANIPAGTTFTISGTTLTLSAAATATAAGTPLAVNSANLTSGGALLNGTNGFRLDGTACGDQLGSGVALADINGDGILDIVVGASNASFNSKATSGSVYVIYGSNVAGKMKDGTTAWAANQLVASGSTGAINGINGFRLDGATAGDATGSGVAVGDINGDGKADLLIASQGAGYNSLAASGSAYVVFGNGTGILPQSITATTTHLKACMVVSSATGLAVGQSVNVLGITAGTTITAIGAACSTVCVAGPTCITINATVSTAYTGTPLHIVSGLLTNGAYPIDGTHGFRLDGATASYNLGNPQFYLQQPVALGDVNGDGYADMVIAARTAGYNGLATSGSVYVVYGGPTMKDGTAWTACPCMLTSSLAVPGSKPIDGANGFRLDGDNTAANGSFGQTVTVGDINRDGYADILTSGYNFSGGLNFGSAYVVYGAPSGKMADGTAWAANQKLSSTAAAKPIDGTNGARFDGVLNGTGGDSLFSIAVGDVNGDGYPDILIGAQGSNNNSRALSGGFYLVNGQSCPFTAINNLNNVVSAPAVCSPNATVHNIWVADTSNNRVQEFSSNGVYQSQFGTAGSGNGHFSSPYNIAIDGSGNIWVPDYGNNRVEKFNSSGVYQSQFGTSGSGNGQFSYPYGIAIDSSGNIWVTDHGNNRVQEFNSSGTYVSQFGSAGTGNGQFSYPYNIAIDGSGNIWVADPGNNRVEKFNSSGVYQSQFGTSGSGNGQFLQPTGIATDSSGNIWVADAANNRMQKFNSSGAYQSQFGTSGSGNGQLANPTGIAIDSSGNIWVVDYGNNRVQEFNSSGVYQSQFGTAGSGNGHFNGPQGIAIH
jgi:sugar lactone lactonase YvrE